MRTFVFPSTYRMLGPPGRGARPPSSYGSMRTASSSSSSDLSDLGLVDDERLTVDSGRSPAVRPHFTAASAPQENWYEPT